MPTHTPELGHRLSQLTDADAIDLLRRIAEGQREAASSPAASDLLAAAAPLAAGDAAPLPSDGEAARLALALLAEESRYASILEAMLSNPPPRHFAIDPVTGSLLAAGLLIALQTHVEFIRNPDKTWSLKIIKKPSSNSLLAQMIKKLAALMK